jgi:uroporphyrinogen-III synthase
MADLDGLTLVITRPYSQAAASAAWFESLGARVILFPVLAIEPIPDATIDENFVRHDLATANAIIFVSANAAEYGVAAIQTRGGFSNETTIFAIGKATTEKLGTAGLVNVQLPDAGNDSEALLALPALQNVQGQNIVIVRGISEAGGRAHLQVTLRARGAHVAMLECYIRRAVQVDDESRSRLKEALLHHKVHAISVLSVETLESLIANLANENVAKGLHECMMLVPHPRVADAARKLGFAKVSVVPMGGEALHGALLNLKPALLG